MDDFRKHCAYIICDTCEMGCCENGEPACAERSNVYTCGIVKEKTEEMKEVFLDTVKGALGIE